VGSSLLAAAIVWGSSLEVSQPVVVVATATSDVAGAMNTKPPSTTVTKQAAPDPRKLGSQESPMLLLENLARSRAGVPPLVIDPALSAVASLRARDMARHPYFAHTSPTGETAFSLMARLGVDYSIAAENIARNNYPASLSTYTAFAGFMESPSHRANILNPTFQRLGIAEAEGEDGLTYFVLIFADP
jgi:uncharacterized protein YkwD